MADRYRKSKPHDAQPSGPTLHFASVRRASKDLVADLCFVIFGAEDRLALTERVSASARQKSTVSATKRRLLTRTLDGPARSNAPINKHTYKTYVHI